MIDSKTDEQSSIIEESNLPEEIVFENTLRPSNLDEFIGQDNLKANLHIVIEAAKKRGDQLEHILLYGPPGLGKTSLAYIIGKQIGANVKTTSGPAIERAGDLASILTNLQNGDILFIDEIHRLNKVVEEVLYPAMEDGVLDIVLGKGPGARSIRMELPKFTIIGATTRIGLIAGPLRDRFGIVYHLEYYNPEDLHKIIQRSAVILRTLIDPEASFELGKRSRFTPRIANRLLKRVRDFAQVHGHDTISTETVTESLRMLGIDELGLDNRDRNILSVLIEKFSGGPTGLSTLAAATGEEQDTITDVYEPFLIRQGLLTRTQKGRVATESAWIHIGKTPPSTNQTLL